MATTIMSNTTLIRSVTALLVLLFVASFLSPALCNQRDGEVCTQAFPGYLAAMGSMLVIRELFADTEDFLEHPLGGLCATTAWVANIPFILVALQLLISPKPRRLRWAVIATAVAAVDAWLVPFVIMPKGSSMQEILLRGYWLWVSSLSLMAIWTFAVDRAWRRPQT
ncbi:MAG: hypothetical protein QOH06_1250 [Acidobacteriota bacterium]|jgi:hypothetical protein|nr:hypothetical protein [Acidobacteriota bacterium]